MPGLALGLYLGSGRAGGSPTPPIDPPTVLTAPTITLDGYTATITLGAFSGADSTAHELLVDGVSVGPVSAGTHDVSEYAGSTLVVRAMGTNAAGSTVNDSDPAVVFVIQSQFGMNQTSISYWVGSRPYVNMATHEPWRVSTGGVNGYEADSSYVDKHGDIIAMRSGATYNKYMGRTGPNTTYKYRATWTGPGTVQSVSAHVNCTISGASLVSPNVYEWTVTYNVDPEIIGQFSINFAHTDAANPVIGLDIREIDASGNYIHGKDVKFTPEYLALQSGIGTLRFMDWININGGSATPPLPLTWDERTPVDCLSPQARHIAASLTVGSGTSQLVFTAAGAQDTLQPHIADTGQTAIMNALVASGMRITHGAAGNLINVQVMAAAASSNVAISFAGGEIAIAITPQSGATDADSIAALVNTNPAVRPFIIATSGGDGAVTPFSATYLSGGVDAQNPSGRPVEDLVEICNLKNCDLHFQFQHMATDDYVTGALTYIRDHLKAGLKLHLELSNEVWNTAPPYRSSTIWHAALGIYANGAPASPTTDWFMPYSGYAYRFRQIMEIAEGIFADQRDRLIRTATCINAWAGGVSTIITNFLKAPADGGDASLYIGDHVDEMVTAPYYGWDVFDPGGLRNRGAWSNGMVLAQFDYVYYAADSTLYFATDAHTSSFASPDLDPQLLPFTSENLTPFMYRSMKANYTQAKTKLADVLPSYVNDLGVHPKYGSYEAGPHFNVADPGGAGTAIALAALKGILTDPMMKIWEGVYLSEYRQAFGENAILRQFAHANGEWRLGMNFGVRTADWSTDAAAPRAVAFRNATQGKFPTYWWLDPITNEISIPSVSGARTIGETLTAEVGVLRNADEVVIQWLRDGADIEDATGSTYEQTDVDNGCIIDIRVTATGTVNSAVAESASDEETVPVAPELTTVVLKTGSSWTVPEDCDGTLTVHCIGPGGLGQRKADDNSFTAGGGGGGEYRSSTLSGLSGTVSYQVGMRGTGLPSWFVSDTTVKANAGGDGGLGVKNVSLAVGGAGGTGGIGDAGAPGGRGGNATGDITQGTETGGGGAGGPHGPGGNGGDTNTSNPVNGPTGGGGANGGGNASGRNGGNNRFGAGGGLFVKDQLGGNGSDGGGGAATQITGDVHDTSNGSNDLIWQDSITGEWVGPGSGAGGVQANTGSLGHAGYGGGGGAFVGSITLGSGHAGDTNALFPGDGLIVVQYVPV